MPSVTSTSHFSVLWSCFGPSSCPSLGLQPSCQISKSSSEAVSPSLPLLQTTWEPWPKRVHWLSLLGWTRDFTCFIFSRKSSLFLWPVVFFDFQVPCWSIFMGILFYHPDRMRGSGAPSTGMLSNSLSRNIGDYKGEQKSELTCIGMLYFSSGQSDVRMHTRSEPDCSVDGAEWIRLYVEPRARGLPSTPLVVAVFKALEDLISLKMNILLCMSFRKWQHTLYRLPDLASFFKKSTLCLWDSFTVLHEPLVLSLTIVLCEHGITII